jgi:hypothetical protein
MREKSHLGNSTPICKLTLIDGQLIAIILSHDLEFDVAKMLKERNIYQNVKSVFFAAATLDGCDFEFNGMNIAEKTFPLKIKFSQR